MDDVNGAYVFVLPVQAYRVSDGRFAIESAFAVHLRNLRQQLGALAERVVIVAPGMSDEDYERSQASLAEIDEADSGIRFREAFPASLGRIGFMKHLPRTMAVLLEEVRHARVVHAGGSPLFRPFEFPALLMAHALGKKTIFVTDIDERDSPRMNRIIGTWSSRQYWTTTLLHQPFTHLQHVIAARTFSLVLLKGAKLARDYGGDRSNVHDFLDVAFDAEQLIDPERLERKLAAASDPESPLEVVYFGRLVGYKGVDRMLRALRVAVDAGAQRIRFHVIGDGPEARALSELTRTLRLTDVVQFHGAVPFGEALFDRLYAAHLLLAAPLSEDTPRSALDAMAAGQALLAYDTYYYRELADKGGGVRLVPWDNVEALGTALADLAADRGQLVTLMRRGSRFARDNTQQQWLMRRVAWTRAAVGTPEH